MKKLLLCSLIAMSGISFGKELTVVPEVLAEEKTIENKEPEMMSKDVVSETVMVNDDLLNNLYLRVGVSPASGYDKFSIKDGNESKRITDGKSDSLGYELGIEYTRNLNKNLELGLGALYQNNPKLKSYSVERGVTSHLGKYDSLPVYLTAKYSFDGFDNGIRPYLKGNAGYSFNFNEQSGYFLDGGQKYTHSAKVTNGIYLALGGGIEYKNIGIDLMYQVNGADLSLKDKETGMNSKKDSFSNAKVTLGLSYKFEY